VNALRKIASKPKYYFIFPVVVAALFSTSFIQVPCPVCDGKGTIALSVGMDNVRIVSIESRIISTTQDACTSYVVVRANPIITVTNTSTEQATGYLKLNLIDLTTGNILVSQHLAVNAAPSALTVLQCDQFAFAYESVDKPPEEMDIQGEVVNENVPCLACSGTGKVSLNALLLTQSYKDDFITTTRSQSNYIVDDWTIINGQRVLIGSKEWLDWMELN
jgi:hypothetical protein